LTASAFLGHQGVGAAVEQGGAVVGVPELVGEAVLVTVGVGRHGGRQGCPVVGEPVLVGEVVLVGEAVGRHGGRQGCPVVGEPVLVGEAGGTHGAAVLVAEGVLVAVG